MYDASVISKSLNMNNTQIEVTAEDYRIAKLAALAISLHLLEALIPSPLPGVKPGIANIITLYVLYQFGFATAAWVSIMRVFAGSLILGQFLSPTFVLSLAGALLSLLVLRFASYLPKTHFSPISLSVLAALGHVAGQLLVVRFWLIPHAGVAYLVPIFSLTAVFFGLINGVITAKLLREATHHGVS